jgi:hypothetical protein
MIDHNIVWFDISVYHIGNTMTIVKGLKHVNEVRPHIFANHLDQRSFALPFCHEVDVVLVWVVDDLVQPDNVRVLKSLQHLELLKDAVICTFALASFFLFKYLLIHFFKCIFDFSVFIKPEEYCGKTALPEYFYQLILVYLFFILVEL